MSISRVLYEERQNRIDDLRNRIRKNRFESIEELKQECDKYNLDAFEDVLLPMGWNACDRCESLCDAELDLVWLDTELNENEPKEKAVLAGLQKEPFEYCAVCYKCFNELAEAGGWRDDADAPKA